MPQISKDNSEIISTIYFKKKTNKKQALLYYWWVTRNLLTCSLSSLLNLIRPSLMALFFNAMTINKCMLEDSSIIPLDENN